jgi:hypothetical protein
MQAKKFELFMCHLGNGITVCNKAVEEHGNYKMVAHISEGGNIKLYVPEDYIPPEVIGIIRHEAEMQAKIYHEWFERNSIIDQYEMILDNMPHSEFIEVVHDARPLVEKLPELRLIYYKRA